ncbi:DUF1345 domain-containing protein [Streptomyces sp. NPDC001728]|uniref:DUF1345 domain-containing protein n=1 Tax=Streptomyces sp. NPDC001728 TaxID=3154396 RepID=UPI003323EF3E
MPPRLLLAAVPRLAASMVVGAAAGRLVGALTHGPLGVLTGIAVAEQQFVVAGGLAGIVVLLLVGRSDLSHAAAATALGGVSMSWAALHLMYATRYAYLHYRKPGGGIDFNPPEPPRHSCSRCAGHGCEPQAKCSRPASGQSRSGLSLDGAAGTGMS